LSGSTPHCCEADDVGREQRTQLLLFLDDLAPSLFGKPLLQR